MKHLMKCVATVLVLVLYGVALAQATTQEMGKIDASVDIGDYSLNIVCTAGTGTPSIIIETGLGEAPTENGAWQPVIEALQDTAQVCIYDRLGLGNSDMALSSTRSSLDVATDLHLLLNAAEVTGPYILVGHSIGGLHTRVYADTYPEDVVGMVLIDASHPDQWAALVGALPPDETSEQVANLRNNFLTNSTDNSEMHDFAVSAAQVRATQQLENIPVVIISQSETNLPGLPLPDEDRQALTDAWHGLQADLLNVSDNSTQLISDDAGHHVYADDPELVIDAILGLIAEVSGG